MIVDKEHKGFRLARLEVYNWGTFNNKIYSINPDGKTTLLTGENGSGKSTLVDALLTLLVPNRKRNYNLASGAERKKERDEKTYVLGAYGRFMDEAARSRPRYLRKVNDYSVLLALFQNNEMKLNVTLAQFFWVEHNQVKKFFVLAKNNLNIEEHFSGMELVKDLKKKLHNLDGVETYNEFSRYSRDFSKIFGFRSPKATDLFNQTVAIKALSDLNDFVRKNMLEKLDSLERIGELKLNYQNLTASHEAIIRARKQLARLEPIEEEGKKYKEFTEQIHKIESILSILRIYFAREKGNLIIKAIENKKTEHAQLDNEVITIKKLLNVLLEQKYKIERALNDLKEFTRLEDIKKQLVSNKEKFDERKAKYNSYRDLARNLHLVEQPTLKEFYSSKQNAAQMKKKNKDKKQFLTLDRDNKIIQLDKVEMRIKEYAKELESLKLRKNLIPANVAEIRSKICNTLVIDEKDIPFVCELIKVKDSEKEWEGAIERLLHGFGLRLLVPEQFYKRISNYVNQTNLKGRLVYYKLLDKGYIKDDSQQRDGDDLFYKLEIKPVEKFKEWIEHELLKRYNHICCNELFRFYRENRAITKEGLVKTGKFLQEKDDRRGIDDKRFYILGWSNKEKIEAFEQALGKLNVDKSRVQIEIARVDKEIKQLDLLGRNIWIFLNDYKEYHLIDWKSIKQEIENLKKEQFELESSSDKLKHLQNQERETAKRIKGNEDKHDEKVGKRGAVKKYLLEYEKELAECGELSGQYREKEDEELFIVIQEKMQNQAIDLNNVDQIKMQVQEDYSTEIKKKVERRGNIETSIVKKMVGYIKDFPQEGSELDAGIEVLDYFCRNLQKIKEEKLPEYESRFKQLLHENVTNDIVGFKSALENQVEDIKTEIDELNSALKTIDYTPSTYIQLEYKSNSDKEIEDFKEMLRICIPDAGVNTPDNNEKCYERVRELIERFDREERWKLKVTDVRNWLNFYARERHLNNHKEKEIYESSSGKSGGQTVKLAYTILASAIAYQYGLCSIKNPGKSFHFIVIDEVFSNLDRSNSQYAMELFQRLNLQVLVITPFDKINIVEPYISTCHLAVNSKDQNDSRVYDITREELKAKRAQMLERNHAEVLDYSSAVTPDILN